MRNTYLQTFLFLIFSITLYSAPFTLNSGHYDSVNDIAKYPYGAIAISVSNDESIIIWDTNQNKILKNIEFGKGSLTSIAISPSGKYFVVGNSRGEIFVFDFASQKMLFSDKLHQSKITDICFAGREDLFFTSGLDGNIFAYNISTKFVEKGITMPAKILSLSVSPDKRVIAGGGEKGNIYFINTDNFQISSVFEKAHSDWVTGTSFSPDGKYLASVGWDMKLNILNSADGRVFKSINVNTEKALNCVDWSNDGKYICCGSSNFNIYIYTAPELLPFATLTGHKGQVYQTMFFDSDSIISTAADAKVNIWSISQKQLLKTYTGF